jgi:hypothetical protein
VRSPYTIPPRDREEKELVDALMSLTRPWTSEQLAPYQAYLGRVGEPESAARIGRVRQALERRASAKS